MEILLTAATPFEIAPTLNFLEKNFEQPQLEIFRRGDLTVRPLVAGVGMVSTAFVLGKFFSDWSPDLAIQAGIAGSFDLSEIGLGEVVSVVSERFADLGIEERDGSFSDLFDLGLLEKNSPPFVAGVLENPSAGEFSFLKKAAGATVNRVSGTAASIQKLREKYPTAQVETMEGAAFFFACLSAGVPFLEIRSISNLVEPRNRSAWDLPTAIRNLNLVLIEILESF